MKSTELDSMLKNQTRLIYGSALFNDIYNFDPNPEHWRICIDERTSKWDVYQINALEDGIESAGKALSKREAYYIKRELLSDLSLSKKPSSLIKLYASGFTAQYIKMKDLICLPGYTAGCVSERNFVQVNAQLLKNNRVRYKEISIEELEKKVRVHRINLLSSEIITLRGAVNGYKSTRNKNLSRYI